MNTITNQSGLQYSYKIDPTGTSLNSSVNSNTITTNLIIGTLGMVKSVDKSYATINDILNYTIVLNNTGNILLSDIVVKDIIPSGASFVSGSVKVDNISQPTYDIVAGVNVGSLIILGTKTITFQAKVTALPTPNTIINKATSTFNYLVTSLVSGSATSNSVTTTINVTNVSIVKSANVTDVESGNEIIYTSVVTNSGTVAATNITFTDILNSKLQFVTGSVTINGTAQASYNPNTGFNLPDINPLGTATVVFKAKVL